MVSIVFQSGELINNSLSTKRQGSFSIVTISYLKNFVSFVFASSLDALCLKESSLRQLLLLLSGRVCLSIVSRLTLLVSWLLFLLIGLLAEHCVLLIFHRDVLSILKSDSLVPTVLRAILLSQGLRLDPRFSLYRLQQGNIVHIFLRPDAGTLSSYYLRHLELLLIS